MVTKASLPSAESMNLPRSFIIGTGLPITDCAAVAPRQTRICGLHYFYFDLEPRPACHNLANRGLLMQAPLATPNPLEVLHRIGHINFIARNARVFQRPVKYAAGRPDERFHLFGPQCRRAARLSASHWRGWAPRQKQSELHCGKDRIPCSS